MTSLGDVVRHLLAVREGLDEAALTAMRAKADAEQTLVHLTNIRRGSGDQRLATAVSDAEVARDKAGRYARLLADAARHITAYMNDVVPGSAPTGPAKQATPSGDRLVAEAGSRGRRADIAWRRQVQKADSTEDSLKNAEANATEMFKLLKHQHRNQGGSATGSGSTPHIPVQERPQVDSPVTAVVMAAGALAVVARTVWNHGQARRKKRRGDDDQS